MTRVLVVEDEESYRDALSYMLSREGFEVIEASTGASGISASGHCALTWSSISAYRRGIWRRNV